MARAVCALVCAAPALLALLLSGCDKSDEPHHYDEFPPDTRTQVTIRQGVWGNVWFWEGNFMPPGWGTITPVIRTVYAYEPTSSDQVKQVPYSCFFWSINSHLVAKTTSNSTGFFQMELPPGRYSFFVREGSQFYANGDDGRYILPATVGTGSVTKMQIDITYKACY